MAVRYADDFTRWKVTALNFLAKNLTPEPVVMNEKEWVAFLYFMRDRPPPNDKALAIEDDCPPPEGRP